MLPSVLSSFTRRHAVPNRYQAQRYLKNVSVFSRFHTVNEVQCYTQAYPSFHYSFLHYQPNDFNFCVFYSAMKMFAQDRGFNVLQG